MNFDLTDDQRALVDTVEKFAASATARRAGASDAATAVAGLVGRWTQMAELGLAGLLIDEADGGIGMTMADAILVCEALGQSLAQEPFITAAIVAPKLIEQSTASDVRSSCLAAIGEGSARIAFAGEESVLAFDLAEITARVDARDGVLRLSGVKHLVIDGASATHFVVLARDKDEAPNAFFVAANEPGVSVTPIRTLDGGWLARVSFEEVEVRGPLFERDTAVAQIECALDHGIVALCAESLGLINRALALTAGYLQTRQQFGKAIGSFQALQHRFADMVVAAEQAKSATFMAAAALSEGDATFRKREVSAAKSLVCRHGRAILEGAIQLHGGIGITDEYELSRYVRRMLEIEKSWGDAIDHEARFAAMIE